MYVPILKGKEGEYGALKALPYSRLTLVSPLLEITPVANSPTDMRDRTKKQANKMKKAWRYAMQPFFIDTHLMPSSGEALAFLAKELAGYAAVPVSGPDRDESYVAEMQCIIMKRPSLGACYRVPSRFIFDPSLGARLAEFLADNGLPANVVDIVLDQEYFTTFTPERLWALIGRINSFPFLSEWRSFTMAGGSFPQDLTGFPRGLSSVPRVEFALWNELTLTQALVRIPQFGDYGIQNPVLSNAAFPGSANIRYTREREWFVLRGQIVDHRFPETTPAVLMKPLCEDLVSREWYCGADFSPADEYYHECATGQASPADSQTDWKLMAFNHHITFVASQVSDN